jgi:hypothetical protein
MTEPMRCPTTPKPYDDDPSEMMAGCGSTSLMGPDREGLMDCNDCGIWFKPAEEYGQDWATRYSLRNRP